MIKILKYIFIGWLVLSVLTAPFYGPYVRMVWVFIPVISAPNYEEPATKVDARRQDIDYLSTLTQYDRSFRDSAKVTFSEKLGAIDAAASDLTDAQFYLAMAEAVALADNGHTNISYHPQYSEFNTIGARLYAFQEGVFIVSAAPDKAHTLGRRVVSVEDIPIDTLQSELGKYRGGNESWRTLYSTLLVESPALLAAAGKAKSSEAIELLLESETGALERVQFAGHTLDDAKSASWRSAWRTLVPGGATAEYPDWRHVLDGEGASMPHFLTNPDAPLSYPLEENGLYIRALPGFAAGEQSIKSAYKSMLADHPDESLEYLVVDFRLHDGGDYLKSMAFAKAAPKAVKADGDVYIITGPNTFSAAIVTVAMLKYYSGDRAIIIGEQMGDREQFWAERGSSFQLPNSGYYVNYATGYHDWDKGCKGQTYCYTMNVMHEVPAGSLSPAIDIIQDFESYKLGEDVVMNWIEAQR